MLKVAGESRGDSLLRTDCHAIPALVGDRGGNHLYGEPDLQFDEIGPVLVVDFCVGYRTGLQTLPGTVACWRLYSRHQLGVKMDFPLSPLMAYLAGHRGGELYQLMIEKR